MNVIVMIAASLLPAVVLLLYIWMKDTQKEPTYMLLKAVAWGIGIVIPVVVMETMIKMMLFGQGGAPTTLADTTALAFLVAAIPEETFKLLALWMVLKKNPYFDEHFDGIVYAVCVGLGFAAVENVSYVFSQENWAAVAVTRALLAVPGHYAFAVLMGYYYSVYHFVNRSPKVAVCVLLAPVLAHGIYDALAMSSMVNPYVGGVGFAILIVFCIKMHKRAYAKVQALVEKDRWIGTDNNC
jgi:RsiW-degrading membrane proteinase PrsW (M82 family)